MLRGGCEGGCGSSFSLLVPDFPQLSPTYFFRFVNPISSNWRQILMNSRVVNDYLLSTKLNCMATSVVYNYSCLHVYLWRMFQKSLPVVNMNRRNTRTVLKLNFFGIIYTYCRLYTLFICNILNTVIHLVDESAQTTWVTQKTPSHTFSFSHKRLSSFIFVEPLG